MSGVDLSRYRFDYDLTFCCLLMNADGTIYHVYGGRDASDPQSHLSIPSLVGVLQATLEQHVAYEKHPAPPKLAERRVVEDSAAMKRKKKQDCVHCHTIHNVQHEDAVALGVWKPEDAWIYPDPVQIGIAKLDRDAQTRVTDVDAGSAAARVGIKPGDVIESLGGGPQLLTFGDLQQALHSLPDGRAAQRTGITWTRKGKRHEGTLRLKPGWKKPTPAVYAWRPYKWPLSPKPGFGGSPLDDDEKKALGIPASTFAFRVGYIVTWGPNAYTGRNAAKAGIRKHDVVYEVCGKRDFLDMHHFHAWFRLTRKSGDSCAIKLVRGKKRVEIEMPILE